MEPTQRDVLPILWGAFVVAHTLFVGVTLFLPAEPMPDASWVPLLGLAALLPAGLSVQAGLFARLATNLQSWFLFRFALAEAAAIMGFLAYFVSGDRVVQLGCATLGILAHLVAFPSAGARAQFAEAKR